MTLKTKLEEMRKRCEAATPGPWDQRCLNTMDNTAEPRMAWVAEAHGFHEICIPNAAFIAAARTDMPALISALEVCLGALYAQHSEWGTDNNCHAECSATCKALASAEKILGGGE